MGEVAKFQPELAKAMNLKVFALGRKISTISSALKYKMAVFFTFKFPVFLLETM